MAMYLLVMYTRMYFFSAHCLSNTTAGDYSLFYFLFGIKRLIFVLIYA